MEQDKELLFTDLSARLPSRVKVKMGDFDYILIGIEPKYENGSIIDMQAALVGLEKDKEFVIHVPLNLVKPYLRPMSSMTEEEKKDYHKRCIIKYIKASPGLRYNGWYEHYDTYKSFDWLLKNHFDFRGLISKGLAIEVTEDNNPYKSK